MYFGFFLGIPYITWKLSQHSDDSNDSTNNATQNSQNWKTGVGEHYVAKATFDFQSNQNGELNFKTGDMLNVAPKHLQPQGRGWFFHLLYYYNSNHHLVLILIFNLKVGYWQA